MIRFIASALIAATLVSATSVSAADTIEAQAVHYGDLNISSSAGMKVLQFRLKAAVRSVCGDPDLRDLKMTVLSRRCRAQAEASIASQIASVVNNQQQTAARASGIQVASR